MTDHHDFGDHHDDLAHDPGSHDDLPAYDDHQSFEHPAFEEHDGWDVPGGHDDHGVPETAHHDDTQPAADDVPEPAHAVLADLHDDGASQADVFPPQVDVGDLPEPVDGFPWIDPAMLGAAAPALHSALEQVDPHELAAYAGIDLPPGADPWEALAHSDDPATAALARFWSEN